MNRLADETGIKGNIKSMKPTTSEQKDSPYKISRVDMRLESVTLAQLTNYLHRVETSTGAISIRKMVITKKDDTENLLSVILQVETLVT
jgi:general secretion pathway protein M